ncbi:hypothetical protein B0O80DRAFT_500121 [Mortierella sp. GBAus27b]|nr:hypothetical protein BGX31_000223 [Mortierella sp. GBA43]KAI8351251.1 hypothetical protein B0O80DRAFT_500121 [Mortierella sp. GBAus27b]
MNASMTQPADNKTFSGCNSAYNYTSWSSGACSKAERKAHKKNAKASKHEARSFSKQVKCQVKELKHEIKHQTEELKREIKHQAKEFEKEARHQAKELEKEARHQSQEALKTLKRNFPEDRNCDHRHGCHGHRHQRKHERHAWRDRHHHHHHHSHTPLHCLIRSVIKHSLRLLAGPEPQSHDSQSHDQRPRVIVRPEPLMIAPAVAQPIPGMYPAPNVHDLIGGPQDSKIPQEPLLVYAMSSMTLTPHPTEMLPPQAPTVSSSRLETPATATPRPDLEFAYQEDHDNVDYDGPPPPYQPSAPHK